MRYHRCWQGISNVVFRQTKLKLLLTADFAAQLGQLNRRRLLRAKTQLIALLPELFIDEADPPLVHEERFRPKRNSIPACRLAFDLELRLPEQIGTSEVDLVGRLFLGRIEDLYVHFHWPEESGLEENATHWAVSLRFDGQSIPEVSLPFVVECDGACVAP